MGQCIYFLQKIPKRTNSQGFSIIFLPHLLDWPCTNIIILRSTIRICSHLQSPSVACWCMLHKPLSKSKLNCFVCVSALKEYYIDFQNMEFHKKTFLMTVFYADKFYLLITSDFTCCSDYACVFQSRRCRFSSQVFPIKMELLQVPSAWWSSLYVCLWFRQ